MNFLTQFRRHLRGNRTSPFHLVKEHKLYLIFILFEIFRNTLNVRAAIHTNEFAVNIPSGDLAANEIAEKYGFVNRGQIGSLKGYYLFEHHNIRKRSLAASLVHSELLLKDSSVLWFEQQVVKRRVKRVAVKKSFSGFPDPLYADQWFLHGGGYGNNDMNVIPAWEEGYTGKGVVVSILDDGIQGNHPDLAQNYDKNASYDINDSDDDPTPQDDDDNKHGTRCAGEVAAVANNEFCGVGIAYNASIGGVRMLDGSVTDSIEATALSLKPDHIHIYSASWGPEDDGKTVDGPGKLAKAAFEEGITKGRGGLGSIFVWASGNGGGHNDNCNCDGYTNSIYTISVSSATQSGLKPWYLEQCSSTLATTYSSGTSNIDHNIVTVDVDYNTVKELEQGKKPTSSKLCTKSHTGTSASAPIAAAICALALEANRNLTWRDMQYLIVMTSRYEPLWKEAGWIQNGIGRRVSTMFGFGLMDAAAMVKLAKKWKSVSNQHICYTSPDTTERYIPATKGGRLETSISTTGCKNSSNSVESLEHVQARITLHFRPRGSLRIILISPFGTESEILLPRPHDHVEGSFNDWPFMSVHFWGESPEGTWKLLVINDGIPDTNDPGKLTNWSLVFYGTPDQPLSPLILKNAQISSYIESESEHTYPVRGVTKFNEASNVCSDENKFLAEIKGRNECVDKCPPGQYENLADFTCHICDKSCSSCYGPSYNNCLSCQKYFLSNNMCVKTCPDGFFPDTPHHMCYPCLSTCTTCELNEVCSYCKPGLFQYNQKCVTICPEGTFSQNQICRKCHDTCATCYGPLSFQCITCHASQLLHNGSCHLECPKKFYGTENFICLRCHRSCDSCIDNNFCSRCSSEWNHHLSNKCVYNSVCNKGWNNVDQGTCDNCVRNCYQCSGPNDLDCTSCESGYHWLEGQCYKECPDDYFISGDECSPCYKLCSECESNGKCLSCKEGYFLYFGKCFPSCPLGFYDNGQGKCEMCHSECLHCNGNSKFNCTSCRMGSYLVEQSCQTKCPDGYFPAMHEESECLPCYSTCKTCSKFGPLHCSSCFDNSSFHEGTCIPCLDGEFYNKNSKECERCHYKCGRCFGPSDNNCLSCTAPLRLDEIKHVCLPCCLSTRDSECCTCSKNLDICINSDHPRSVVSISTQVFDEVTIPLRHIVPIVIAICSSVVLLYALVFGLLQAHSMGWCNIKFRGQRYERVPNNLAAKFDAEMEKISLTQDDLEEEDEIYEKV